jgi:hypothetical protein
LTPSALPSNIHSSLPSLYPLALPSDACPYGGFLGRAFKSVICNKCLIFESYLIIFLPFLIFLFYCIRKNGQNKKYGLKKCSNPDNRTKFFRHEQYRNDEHKRTRRNGLTDEIELLNE